MTSPRIERIPTHVCPGRALRRKTTLAGWLGLLLAGALAEVGCVGTPQPRTAAYAPPPREELSRSLAQDRIKTSDVLQLKLPGDNTATATLNRTYQVAPDGTVELVGYGKVEVAGKTVEEAKQAVYEAVAVSSDVKQAIELARSEYFLVTVAADGTRQLTRVPLKGPVKVKDALAGTPGLSTKVIWIARPSSGGGSATDRILPVDWDAVARSLDESTNYELKAGDFLCVAHEPAQGFGRFFGAFTSMLSGPDRQERQGRSSAPAESASPSGPPAAGRGLQQPKVF